MLIRRVLSLVIILKIFFVFGHSIAHAHSPHDVIDDMAFSPNYLEDGTLYTIARQNLFKSEDFGSSWIRIADGVRNLVRLDRIFISPNDAQKIYLINKEAFFLSTDAGDTWQSFNLPPPLMGSGSKYQGDHDALMIHAERDYLIRLSDRGFYVLDSELQKLRLEQRNQEFKAAAVLRNNKKESLLLLDQNGQVYNYTFATDQNSQDSSALILSPSEEIKDLCQSSVHDQSGILCYINAENQIILYHTNRRQIFFRSNPVSGEIREVVFSSLKDKKIIVTTTRDGVFISQNYANWQKNESGLTTDQQATLAEYQLPDFTKILFSPAYDQDHTILIAGFDGLFMSKSAGIVWEQLGVMTAGIISGLNFSPNFLEDHTIAYATHHAGFFLSKNGGQTWGKGLPAFDHHGRPRRLFSVWFAPDYVQTKQLFSGHWSSLLNFDYLNKKINRRTITQDGIINKSLADYSHSGNRVKQIFFSFAPNYLESRVIYLATHTGEIFKSDRTQKKFFLIKKFPTTKLLDFQLSPAFKADRTFYVLTEEGLWQGDDKESTWRKSESKEMLPYGDKKLTFSPNFANDQTLALGTIDGLFVSYDNADSWRKVSPGSIQAVAFSPDFKLKEKGTFIFSVKGEGVYLAHEGRLQSKSFQRVPQDLNFTNPANLNSSSPAIVFSPTYAHDRAIGGYNWDQIYLSKDAGATWEKLKLPKYEYLTDKNRTVYINKFLQKNWIRALIAIFLTALLGIVIRFFLFPVKNKNTHWIIIFLVLLLTFYLILIGLNSLVTIKF